MNLKLCIIAATVCGLEGVKRHSQSPKSHLKSAGTAGQAMQQQIDDLKSYSLLANYNKALVKSNLK